MKKNKLLLVSAFLMLLGVNVTSCYDDKADIAFYSGEQLIDQVGTCTNFVSEVTFYTNSSYLTRDIGIAYGKGGYQAVSSDAEVVKVAVKGERLNLTAGGKSGKATVTVTDEKGNQAILPVASGIGTREWGCIYTKIVPLKGGEVQKDIEEAVGEAMKDYAPLVKDGKFVLVPTDMDRLEDGGELQVYKDAQASAIEGSFEYSVVDVGERPVARFKFIYDGETHVFDVSDLSVVSNSDSRSIGVIPYYLHEDITSRFKETNPDFTLPDDVKIYCLIKCYSKNGLMD